MNFIGEAPQLRGRRRGQILIKSGKLFDTCFFRLPNDLSFHIPLFDERVTEVPLSPKLVSCLFCAGIVQWPLYIPFPRGIKPSPLLMASPQPFHFASCLFSGFLKCFDSGHSMSTIPDIIWESMPSWWPFRLLVKIPAFPPTFTSCLVRNSQIKSCCIKTLWLLRKDPTHP